MRNLLIALSIIVLTGGCRQKTVEPQNACTTANPLENVDWLKQMRDNLKCTPIYQYSIVKAVYQRQTVFYVNFSCSTCDYVFRATLLNCEGNEVRTFANSLAEMQAFDTEVIDRQVIYACTP